jgi:nucleoside-diphosphate-sugar epimerase
MINLYHVLSGCPGCRRKVTHIGVSNDGSPDAWGKAFGDCHPTAEVNPFDPDWDDLDHPDAYVKDGQYGKYNARAGFIRNEEMAVHAAMQPGPSRLIAFWDGESNGTENMIENAEEHGVPVKVFRLDRDSEREVLLSHV